MDINNPYCTFYIVRHAQSHGNIKRIISGQQDTNLSDEGRLQAFERGKELVSIHFDAAFSSDLSRAHETATIIAKEHDLAVTALQILRERHFGAIQGTAGDDLEESLKKKLEEYNNMNYKERLLVKIVPGMENDEEVIGRFETFLRETALAYPGKTVLVVAHGNLMRTFLVHLGLGTYQEFGHGSVSNTGYFVLRSDGVNFEVQKMVGINKIIVKGK